MKTAGIIGGIGPPSTIEYYRQIIDLYRARKPDGSYPPLIINSIDLNRMRTWIEANLLSNAAEYLLSEIRKLADAKADFAVLAANTPHLVFDTLSRRSPIPLISIVEVTLQAAKASGMKRLARRGPMAWSATPVHSSTINSTTFCQPDGCSFIWRVTT